ncbi:MAG: hypothetical protein HY810_00010 [Candidatus Omnitrophica bacterium]|nr:hypothetical protein [Candidatus Omnitrophota bacterium]
MKNQLIAFFVVMIVFGVNSNGSAQEMGDNFEEMNTTLKNVALENFKAYENEDISKIMETVHTQSPGYLATKQLSNEIFPEYDLKYEMLNFKYLIIDGEYALARATQKTSKISGPAFRNNILDVIFVFRQESGKWKFWSQVILGIQYI